MLNRTTLRFRYMDLVIKDEDCFREVMKDIRIDERSSTTPFYIAAMVCNWVSRMIEKVNVPGEMVSIKDLHPCEVLKRSRSTCLGKAVLMTSILRSLAFKASEVFVAVMLHRGEGFKNATHASVLLTPDGKSLEESEVVIFDVVKGSYQRAKIEELLATNIIFIIFNDEVCYVPRKAVM